MQNLLHEREQKRTRKGKYAQPKHAAQAGTPERPIARGMSFASNYVDTRHRSVRRTETECPICLQQFQQGEEVTRLNCDHLLHLGCVDSYVRDTQQEPVLCPICRGPMTFKAAFTHMGVSTQPSMPSTQAVPTGASASW